MTQRIFLQYCGMLLCVVLLQACEWSQKRQLDSEFGQGEVVDRIAQSPHEQTLSEQSQDVLDKRCVVCHACYDAPCQLKLSSLEGLDRGATKQKVYDGKRIVAADTTRLFIDAENTEQWRSKSFYPVLNERTQSPEANLQLSVLYQLLQQKREYPLPAEDLLDEKVFDFAANRSESCPKIETLPAYEKDHPMWGMPYALPAISDSEFTTLESWIEQGAKFAAKVPLAPALQQQMSRWEAFFNGSALKTQLVNRYLYEHLYLANLYFPENERQFFKMVRSSTPPGEPVKIIATRRVYDDPLVATVYYRLVPSYATVVAKTHMPYKLDDARFALWQKLFYEADYEVTSLPSYTPEVASNPFIAFQQLPQNSRYRFLLEEAQFSIMNFIKGPVCRGKIALDVIRDHFWVVFVNPDLERPTEQWYIDQHADLLKLPAQWNSNGSFLSWREMAKGQKKFLQKKVEYYNAHLGDKVPIDMNLIWDGDKGRNPNAALTIYRHYNSATVLKGFAGNAPKTAWVIDYALLERIHYLLVAGFDVYGNLVHQLYTRLYMDFLRMESEENLIAFIPKERRLTMFKSWYVDADKKVEEFYSLMLGSLDPDSAVEYSQTNSAQDNYIDLLQMLETRTSAQRYRLDSKQYPEKLVAAVAAMNRIKGMAVSYLPQSSAVKIIDADKVYWLTLLHNNAHKNMTNVFNEQQARIPEDDNISALPGIIGAYPNAFYEISINDLDGFMQQLQSLASTADYRVFADRFAIRRTNEKFWAFSDELHEAYKHMSQVEYGILDYNRFENQ